MSPFVLASGERVSCMAYGPDRPLEHAGTCACPCAPCIAMHRAVLEHVGLLPRGGGALRLFVHAHDELRVSGELAPGAVGDDWFVGAYRAICDASISGERSYEAAFGWLLRTESADTVRVVKAPSDPSEGEAEESLAAWAAERGIRLLDPLD